GQRQSGISIARVVFCLEKVSNEGAFSVAERRAWKLCGGFAGSMRRAATMSGACDRARQRWLAGIPGERGRWAARRRFCDRVGNGYRAKRCCEHSVHLRHHRFAEGRHAHASECGEQRKDAGGGDAIYGEGSHLCSGALVSLLWLRDRYDVGI